MALPTGAVTTPARHGRFLAPRNRQKVPTADWSRGGAGINDATAGMDVYDWRFRLDGIAVYAGVPGVIAEAAIYTLPAPVEQIAAAFDTNMQPVLGWVTEGAEAWFRWFDPTVPGFTNIQLDAGSFDVRVVMDDPREGQNALRDTLITYLRDGRLYYRQLRDRFEDEYELVDGLDGWRLGQFGMNSKLRMQWQLFKPVVST